VEEDWAAASAKEPPSLPSRGVAVDLSASDPTRRAPKPSAPQIASHIERDGRPQIWLLESQNNRMREQF